MMKYDSFLTIFVLEHLLLCAREKGNLVLPTADKHLAGLAMPRRTPYAVQAPPCQPLLFLSVSPQHGARQLARQQPGHGQKG